MSEGSLKTLQRWNIIKKRLSLSNLLCSAGSSENLPRLIIKNKKNMKCVYCSLSGKEIKNAEFIIKGMSLCSAHYYGWEDELFTIEDVEKGNIEINQD